MSVVGGGLRPDQPDPVADPLDVAVDRHERRPEAEQEEDRGGLLGGRSPSIRVSQSRASRRAGPRGTRASGRRAPRGSSAARPGSGAPSGRSAGNTGLDQFHGRGLNRRPVGRPSGGETRAGPARGGPGDWELDGASWKGLAESIERGPAFTSAVFWVRIVRMSSLVGRAGAPRPGGHPGMQGPRRHGRGPGSARK